MKNFIDKTGIFDECAIKQTKESSKLGSEKMNVILIVIDSLRADHVSCMGYGKKTTPTIDKMGEEGVLFTKAFSYGSITFTSVVPMMTSAPFVAHYLQKYDPAASASESFEGYRNAIKTFLRSKVTVSEALRRNGYETAAFHSNPLLSHYFGLGDDFSYYYDGFNVQRIERGIKMLEVMKSTRGVLSRLGLLESAKKLYSLMPGRVSFERADEINEKVISWFSERKPDKFFVWIQYMDAHFPYKHTRLSLSALKSSLILHKLGLGDVSEKELLLLEESYDKCIRYVDYSIKSLLEKLEDMNLLEDTVIFITSDHGEEFMEHGGFMHTPGKLYDELTHVPLIIHNYKQERKVEELVSLFDLAPTLMDILDLPAPKTFQGRSLVPVINGEMRSENTITIEGVNQEKGSFVAAYRTKHWKFILDESGERELYDVKKDPKESENLYEVESHIAKDLELKTLKHVLHPQKLVAMSTEKEKIRKKIKKLIESQKPS